MTFVFWYIMLNLNWECRVTERRDIPGGIYRSQVPPAAAHLTGTKSKRSYVRLSIRNPLCLQVLVSECLSWLLPQLCQICAIHFSSVSLSRNWKGLHKIICFVMMRISYICTAIYNSWTLAHLWRHTASSQCCRTVSDDWLPFGDVSEMPSLISLRRHRAGLVLRSSVSR